jgi:hypothetical protein
MAVHGETLTHRPRAAATVRADGVDWLQRLCRWFKGLTARDGHIPPVSPYGTWDPQRERFIPLRADAAVDLVATQHGLSWAARIYSSSL